MSHTAFAVNKPYLSPLVLNISGAGSCQGKKLTETKRDSHLREVGTAKARKGG